jgi:cellulose synthase/poly-beta-1,6-N-acetylglucosamine synthase-like glycosyltransferase
MLDRLFSQSILPEQVVVVDWSEKAGHSPFDTWRPSRVRCDYLNLQDATTRRTSAALNLGLDRAEGTIIQFLRDDMVLETEFVEEILLTYRLQPSADGVSGIVTNAPSTRLPAFWWKRIFGFQPVRETDLFPVTTLDEGSMSFRAEVVRGLRFDERLTAGEDADFCKRLRFRHPAKLIVAPRARLARRISQAVGSAGRVVGTPSQLFAR